MFDLLDAATKRIAEEGGGGEVFKNREVYPMNVGTLIQTTAPAWQPVK